MTYVDLKENNLLVKTNNIFAMSEQDDIVAESVQHFA